MSMKNRLNRLEQAQGVNTRCKYLCVTFVGWADGWDTPEEKAKGYKIQPLIRSAGGTGGDVFYLETEQELDDFAARPDVDLTIIQLGYTDDEQGSTHSH